MKDLIRKYKRIFTTFAFIILGYLAITLYVTLKYNFTQVVRVVVQDTLGYNIDFTSVEFSFTNLRVNNVEMKDASDNLVVKAPSVYIRYNLTDAIKGYFISEISVENPEVYLTLYDYYHTNITDALGIDLDSEESSTYSPLKAVRVNNGRLHYRDISYTNEIYKEVINLNGGLTLYNANVDLEFTGYSKEYADEKLTFKLDTSGEETEFSIIGSNLRVTDDLLQYSFDDEGMIEYLGGIADLNLTVRGSNLYGYAYVKEASLLYEELLAPANNIELEAFFNRDRIELFAHGKVLDNTIEFNLNKEGNKLALDFKGKNLNSIDILDNLKSLEVSGVEGIINYAEATLTFDDISEEVPNMLMKAYFRSNKLTYNKSSIEEFKGELNYNLKEDRFYIRDARLIGNFMEVSALPISTKLTLNGYFDKNDVNIDYTLSNKESFFGSEELKGNLNYNFSKEELLVKNDSKDVDLNVYINFQSGLLELKGALKERININTSYEVSSSLDSQVDISYNYKTRELFRGKGKLDLENGNVFDELALTIDNDEKNLIVKEFYIKKGESFVDVEGEINLEKLRYKGEVKDFSLNSKNYEGNEVIPDFSINGSFDFEGEKEDVEVNYSIKVPYFDYYLKLEEINLDGKISYINNELEGTMEGYTDLFDYDPISFRDLYLNLTFSKDQIKIKHLKNRYVYINGEYSIKENNLDLNYLLEDYNLDKINLPIEVLKGHLGELSGKVEGNLENPYLSVNLEKSNLNINETEEAFVGGHIDFEGYKLFLKEFVFKNNKISGEIDFNKKTLDLKVNLLESDLNKYYGDANIKYRVIGQLNLWGDFDNIKAVSSVNIDNIYYRGEKIPDFFAKFSYGGGSIYNFLESGKVSLTGLSLLGEDDRSILDAVGYFDISTREFFFTLDNQRVNAESLQYLFEGIKLNGYVNLNFEIKGIAGESLDYSFDINSKGLSYNDIVIDSIEGKVYGDTQKVHIDYINMEYDDNKLVSQGNFNLESLEYYFTMNADDLNLEVLNLFLIGRVEGIKGIADIDFLLSNEKTEGTIEVRNTEFSLLNNEITFLDINSKVRFNQNGMRIEEFGGKVNEGALDIDGYFNIPEISQEILADRSLLLSDYEFKIKLDKMKYNYEKLILLTLSSDLTMKNNILTGDIIVNNGTVFKIPEGKKEEEVLLKNDEKDPSLFDTFYAKLNINTEEGILFNADNIPLVDDIELNIEGGGILEYKEGEIYFTGRLITEKGVLTFNDNFFEVSSGIIVFDDASEAFPNVNPSIALSSKTEISNEEIYINISGYYDSLQLNLSSSSGLNEEDITALLIFKKTLDETSANQVVKDILDRQLSDQIFSPISKEIEKMLNVSKVKISSKLISAEDDEIKVTNDIILGAEIEIQDPLYEDIIYWNIKTKFSEQESGEVESYDLWLDYRINKTFSWRLGADLSERRQENKDKTNIYLGIDFKFDRESIFELWEKY